MTKNCKEMQHRLDRFLRGELNLTDQSAVDNHVATCPHCQAALAFRKALDLRLDGSTEPPAGLRARFEAALDNPAPKRPWLIRTFGETTMKRILISSTALTAVLASVLLLTPSRGQAATAKETFRHMRSALARAVSDGELTVSGVFTATGVANFSVLLDGQPLPPDVPVHVRADDHGDYTDYIITVDLSDSNFSSISYGKDHNTLKLVPKASPNSLDVIKLDPKSQQPKEWTIFRQDGAVSVQTSRLSYIVPDGVVNTNPPVHPTAPPTIQSDRQPVGVTVTATKDGSATHSEVADKSKASDEPITVHIRMGKGSGSASLSIKQN